MHSRLFSSKRNTNKTKLETSIEWSCALSPDLQDKITSIHLAAFMDLYQPYTEAQLGLKPGITKQQWLSKMIKSELKAIKEGEVFIATANIQDTLVGFITCKPTQARHKDLKTDCYINLLAIKPSYRLDKSDKKIQIGLGRQLVDNAIAKFTDANTMILDTRLVNKSGIAFYQALGFKLTGRNTFTDCNPDHYTGCEKQLKRSFI